jgi:hypothetical protein
VGGTVVGGTVAVVVAGFVTSVGASGTGDSSASAPQAQRISSRRRRDIQFFMVLPPAGCGFFYVLYQKATGYATEATQKRQAVFGNLTTLTPHPYRILFSGAIVLTSLPDLLLMVRKVRSNKFYFFKIFYVVPDNIVNNMQPRYPQ